MTYKEEYFKSLKKTVEQSVMRDMAHSSDFDFLYEEIQHRIGETVGVSTLKRLWGYIEGYKTTRESTYDVLCRFVGYPDWHTFCAECFGLADEMTSERVVTATLDVVDIKKGSRVTIEWNPGRRLGLLHNGEGWFTVEEAMNSKVRVGDRFHCERFTIGHPLYVDNLTRDGQPPVLFVMGKKGGLTKVSVK